MYRQAKDRGCKVDWDKILEQAFIAGIEGAIMGLAAGGLGALGSKLISRLNLCGKISNVVNKSLCPGVSAATNVAVGVGSGMAGSAMAESFFPDNCFVAGTPVWVLRDGVDAETANAAVASGADWREYAEMQAIETVKPGQYALSRPEGDADGPLAFNPITETYTNTTAEVVELWHLNPATGVNRRDLYVPDDKAELMHAAPVRLAMDRALRGRGWDIGWGYAIVRGRGYCHVKTCDHWWRVYGRGFG